MQTNPIVLMLWASMLIASDASAQSRDERAEARITRWIDAAGGPRLWDNVRDLQYTVTTAWYDTTGNETRRRPRYVWIRKVENGFRVRVERTEAEGKYIQIWNNGARASLNGVALPDSARAVREVEYVAGDLTYWIGLPWKLRDPGVNLELQSEPNADVVHVTFGEGVGKHDGDRFWYYWHDRNSPFPTEVHYIEEGFSDADRRRVGLSELRSIGPGKYFSVRTVKSAHGMPVRALIVSDVVVNRGIRDSVFR
jgi:hypothetical protein